VKKKFAHMNPPMTASRDAGHPPTAEQITITSR